jgi:asparagine synthase (glutamine-hydrolysing)
MAVTFYGYPRFDKKETAIHLQRDLQAAAELDGRFAVAIQAGKHTSLFCSADGVTQLFYTVQGGELHYGTSVSDVIESAGLNWQWDYEALVDLATFAHLIGDQTLHPAVRRVGSAELIHWDGTALSKETLKLPPTCSTGDPAQEAIDIVLDVVRSEAQPDDLISLSAGFDSRVILAAFLALGLKPNLLVMGGTRSTDATIATEIARSFSLPLERVPLDGSRMIGDRSLISRATSGTKTIDNWHTYEYIAAARSAGTNIWIGSNGEFARTFFVDRGLQFYAAHAVGSPVVKKFWDVKVSRTALPESMRPLLVEELRECLRSERLIARVLRFFPHRSLGETNDQLYLERVRQFIANGLRLVSTRYSPHAPFLHPGWIAAVKRMPRHWKLGNRWHRHAIRQLCPELLRFPYDTSGRPMGHAPGIRYWFGFEPHSHNVPYFDYVHFVRSPSFREAYEAAATTLKGIVRGDDTSALLGQLPLRTTAYMATLSFFSEMQTKSCPTARVEA